MQPPNRLCNAACDRSDTGKRKHATTLWVAGSDRKLIQRLVRISGRRPAIILSSEGLYDSDTFLRHTLELIIDAIRFRDIRRVVLCGQPGDVPFRTEIFQPTHQETRNECERLLQRTCDQIERQHRAEDRIRTQLRQIESNASLASALSAREIELRAVFYVPEHDAFLTYVRAENQFVPTSEATLQQL